MEKIKIILLISKEKGVSDNLKILVKLFANLRDNREKEQYIDVEEATTAKDIIEKIGVPIDDVAIIMINGRRVEMDSILEENDTLAIFPPVGGG